MVIVLVIVAIGVVAACVVMACLSRLSPLDDLARAQAEVRCHDWLTRQKTRRAKEDIDAAAVDALSEIRRAVDEASDDDWSSVS